MGDTIAQQARDKMHIIEGMNCCLTAPLDTAKVPSLVIETTPETALKATFIAVLALGFIGCQKPVEHTPTIAENPAVEPAVAPEPAPTTPESVAKTKVPITKPAPEPTKPSQKKYRPRWMDGLPVTSVTAKVGDRVWATLPNEYDETGTLAVFKVVAVGPNTAQLQDDHGNKTGFINAALIHPTAVPNDPSPGTWVLGDRPDQHHTLGRINRVENGDVWMDVTDIQGSRTQLFPHVHRLTSAVEALGMVFWRKVSRAPWRRGWVVATGDTWIWVLADKSEVHRLAKKQVRPFSWAKEPLADGAGAQCMSAQTGYQPCVVTKQLQADRYEVQWTGTKSKGIVGAQHITTEALP